VYLAARTQDAEDHGNVAAIKVSGAIRLSRCLGHFFWPRSGASRSEGINFR